MSIKQAAKKGENTMLKAKDVMTKDVIRVRKETPIYEAMELLLKNEITGMPVVADDMSLVGIITEKDCLRLFYADEDEKNKTVGHFMTQPAVYYNEDDSLQSVCDFMMINYFRRIPVTSKNGQVVGILSRPDVIAHIVQLRRDEKVHAG
ncbi:MAG TPA: CBS domain-containing protein [Sedimentisphaerales bacterium]|nr:CBS domain-containing protein [Sedimentisphaerales bacterium]